MPAEPLAEESQFSGTEDPSSAAMGAAPADAQASGAAHQGSKPGQGAQQQAGMERTEAQAQNALERPSEAQRPLETAGIPSDGGAKAMRKDRQALSETHTKAPEARPAETADCLQDASVSALAIQNQRQADALSQAVPGPIEEEQTHLGAVGRLKAQQESAKDSSAAVAHGLVERSADRHSAESSAGKGTAQGSAAAASASQAKVAEVVRREDPDPAPASPRVETATEAQQSKGHEKAGPSGAPVTMQPSNATLSSQQTKALPSENSQTGGSAVAQQQLPSQGLTPGIFHPLSFSHNGAAIQAPADVPAQPDEGPPESGGMGSSGTGSFLFQKMRHTGGLAEILAKVGQPVKRAETPPVAPPLFQPLPGSVPPSEAQQREDHPAEPVPMEIDTTARVEAQPDQQALQDGTKVANLQPSIESQHEAGEELLDATEPSAGPGGRQEEAMVDKPADGGPPERHSELVTGTKRKLEDMAVANEPGQWPDEPDHARDDAGAEVQTAEQPEVPDTTVNLLKSKQASLARNL